MSLHQPLKSIALACLSICLLGGQSAQAEPPGLPPLFPVVWVLGDSLSDDGKTSDIFGLIRHSPFGAGSVARMRLLKA